MTDINDKEQATLLKRNHELLDQIQALKRALEQTRHDAFSEKSQLDVTKSLLLQYEHMILENIKLVAVLRAEIEKLSGWLEQADQGYR
jgi:hypothetical protein